MSLAIPGLRQRPRRAAEKAEPRPIRAGESAETISMVGSISMMAALVAFWTLLQLTFLGGLAQERQQHLLYQEFRTHAAAATAPVGPIIPPGEPVATLTIPKLGIQSVVVEGTASGDLTAGPGHRRDTVVPGQIGTSVIYGKSMTYGGVFGELPNIHKGDQIITVSGQGRQVFKVIGIRRAGDPVPAIAAGGAARLTLVTATGTGDFSSVRPSSAIYVDAETPKGFDFPAGRAAAVPAAEQAMASDKTALPLLILALALLVGFAVVVSLVKQRFRPVLVWVLAAPVAICVAWWTTDLVVRVLPNLI